MPNRQETNRQTLRLAIVGVGKIARDQHLPAIAANPGFALVATASPDESVMEVPGYPTLTALLSARVGLDAVVICTPPVVRAELARQALAAGLHVMLEKPPAATVAQLEVLVALAAAARRSLFATWHSRESVAVDRAAAWLAPRRIDRVRVVWREDVRVWHPGQDWLLSADGTGVFDPGINAFSILTRILPEPLAVTQAVLGIPSNRSAPMTANLKMVHGGSAEVTCDVSILKEGEQQWDIRVETDAGVLELTGGGSRLSIDGNRVADAGDAEYPRLYARFADLVASGIGDVDKRPLALVEEAFACGRTVALPGFDF